jgi:hypothetical protein
VGALEGPGSNRFREMAQLVSGIEGIPDLLDSDDRAEARGAERDLERAQEFLYEIGVTTDLAQALGVEEK